MLGKHDTEVLIVGAGPVGMLAALLLAEQGVDVEIIDEQWRTAARSYALTLHPGSMGLLSKLGLTRELIPQGHEVEKIGYYDDNRLRCELKLSELPLEFPFLLVIPQRTLEDVLLSRLKEKGVQVHWSHRLSRLEQEGTQISARIEKLSKESTGYIIARTEWVVEKILPHRARFVIGADGHNSFVRRSLGLKFPQLADPQLFAVFEFAADWEPLDEVRVVLDHHSSSVLWPLEKGRFRWSFQLEDLGERLEPRQKSRLFIQIGGKPFPYLSHEMLGELCRNRAPWFDAEIRDIGWSIAIRFETRLADQFGQDRAWLAGDAAHLAPPIGVHSMNAGLQEVADLTDRLTRILKKGESTTLLQEYDRLCRQEWRQLLGLRMIPAATASADPWVADHARRLLPTIPASGAELKLLRQRLGLKLKSDED